MKRLATSVLVVAIAAAGSLALAESPKMHGRAALSFISPDDKIEVDGDEIDSSIDSAIGLGLGWEYRFNDRIGLDLNLIYGKHDVEVEGRDFDSTRFMPVTVGANFHLTPDKKVDLFVGPFIGYAFFDALENDGVRVELDDDFVYGVNIGVEAPFNDKLAFFGGLRYFKATADGDLQLEESPGPVETAFETVAGAETDLNPLVAQVGIAFRY